MSSSWAQTKAGPDVNLRDLDNDGDLDLIQSFHVDVRDPLEPYSPGEYRQGVMCWKNLLRDTLDRKEFQVQIDTIEQLRSVLGHPNEMTQAKIYSRLTAQAVEFIARSPLMIVATADRHGMPTASPKGDAAGFVHVDGDHTLLIPERIGNKLACSFRNILENPKVGLFFFVPRCVETLRVSGTAELLHDAALAERLQAQGRPALLTLRVTVTEAYFQCGKALIRSSLWQPESWPAESRISFGREIGDNLGEGAMFAESLDGRIQERYRDSLY